MSSSQANAKPTRVLVLGASGSVGGSVVRELGAYNGLDVVRATRKADQAKNWQADGKSAVCIDLDDPRTFPQALKNVDHLYVMTGYTMNMVQHVKTIVDAAVDAGVRFVVHLGVFGNGKSTDPHYAWHELVERYIQGSGIAWCHLHPNFFMENLLSFMPIKDGLISWPMGDGAAGWTAADDIAAVAAKVLAEGPETHAGKDYFLSTDVFNGPQLAEVLSKSLGRRVAAQVIKPDELKEALNANAVPLPAGMDVPFSLSMLELVRQVDDGRLAYAATRTNTIERLLGREPITLANWAAAHEKELLGSDQP